jgi:6-phosphogluconolactonase
MYCQPRIWDNDPSAVESMIHCHADADAVARAAAEHLAESARRASAERGTFRVGLSGGSTPRLLYQRLALPELGAAFDWRRWRIFFSDERSVPPDHPDSNYRMAHEAWFAHVPLPEANIHRIAGELDPAEAAGRYELDLGDEPLDLVLLGIGEDGHTASLFPVPAALAETERRVIPVISPVPPLRRVSLTLRALGEARAVMFLVTGAGKAKRLAQVLAQREQPIGAGDDLLPAARVRPQSGVVHFYVDRAAASELPAAVLE